jgi:hypothetical protein
VPGPGRGELIGGEQAFERVDDGRVGEPGNGRIDNLSRGLGEVQAAADPGRGLAQPARRLLRPGPLDNHKHGAARPGDRLPADREPALAERAAGHGRGPHPPGGDLGQRMADQFALARTGQQHVAHVMPDGGARIVPEQRRGGHRPANDPAPGIQGERGQAGQIRLVPPRQHGLTIPGPM